MATYAQFKHVELFKIGHGKNRYTLDFWNPNNYFKNRFKYSLQKELVPNAPKSSISEIFNSETTDGGSPSSNRGTPQRPRVVRDTPTRPRDTHSRLFGQVVASPPAPMMTDTIRSHIQFGEEHCNGISTPNSNSTPTKLTNGSASSTPSRGETDAERHLSYTPPRRNPVTGEGVVLPPPRRRHPASYRGADPLAHHHPEHFQTYLYDPIIYPQGDPLEPQPSHSYLTRDWPPRPGQYNVESTVKPQVLYDHTPYSLIGLQEEPQGDPEIDFNSLSPQPILDGKTPPFPAQREFNAKPQHQIPYEPLHPHSYISMKSVLDDRPSFQYRHVAVPTLDGPVDPYLISNLNPPATIFKYERDGPIPDVSLLQTPQAPGPSTLLGFPPTFHKHVPSYLFKKERHPEELAPKTYYLDYARRRDMEGNPITGDGYKSMNGEINTVTGLHERSSILHNRVPPGGFSSGLW